LPEIAAPPGGRIGEADLAHDIRLGPDIAITEVV
jgi:hypothetical protein